MPEDDWVCHPVKSYVGNPVFTHIFWCPGCLCGHGWTASWTFNGDLVKPTISPSLLVTGGGVGGAKPFEGTGRCHSFVRDGQIQFLDDCTHALRGQTVALEPF